MDSLHSHLDPAQRDALASPDADALNEPGFEGLVFAASCALASLLVYVVVVMLAAH
jgi:hypothetical protein